MQKTLKRGKALRLASVFMAVLLLFTQISTVLPVFASGTGYTKVYDGTTYEVPNTGDVVKSELLKSISNTTVKKIINGMDFGGKSLTDIEAQIDRYSKFGNGLNATLSGHTETDVGVHSVYMNIELTTWIGDTQIGNIFLYTYTITQRPITSVTATNEEIQVNSADTSGVEFGYTLEGVLPSDTVTLSGVTYSTNYATPNSENQTFTITPDITVATVSNSNYTLTGTTVKTGTLTALRQTNYVKDINLTENATYTYDTQDKTADAKAKFVVDAKAALPSELSAHESKITIDKVVVSESEMKNSGTYTLSLNLSGNDDLTYASYDIDFTQTVSIAPYGGVNAVVSGQLGNLDNTKGYAVYKEGSVPNFGTNLLGFYLAVPSTTSDAMIAELKNANLQLVSSNGEISVDVSPLNNNYTIEQQKGTHLNSTFVDAAVGVIENQINSVIKNYLPNAIDLGSFYKEYDGRAFADLEGSEMTSFTNDMLSKIVDALEELESKVGGITSGLPSGLTLPTIPGSVDVGGNSIDISNKISDEINKVINQVNGLISSVTGTVDGAGQTYEDIMNTLNSFGTTTFSLKITETGAGLSNTDEAGESTTLTLSVELAFTISAKQLLGDTALGFLGLDDITVTLPVSVPLATFTAGVKELPVTIYYDDNANDFTTNGGLYITLDPRIMESQIMADHYTTVGALNYALLTDTVKEMLKSDVLNVDKTTTLNSNYAVTVLPMSQDPYYGAIGEDIKDAMDFVDGKIAELEKEISDLIEKGTSDYNAFVTELERIKEEILETKADVEEFLGGKIDTLKPIIDKIEGIDFDAIKDVLEDYAGAAFDRLLDILEEKACDLAEKALEALKEEAENGMDSILKALTDLKPENLGEIIEQIEKAVDIILELKETAEDIIDGFQDGIFKDTLEGLLDSTLTVLDEKLENLAGKALELLMGEVDKLEEILNGKLDTLETELSKVIEKVLADVNSTFPVEVDLGEVSKTYDGKIFSVEELGYVEKLLALTAQAKTAVDGFDVTAISDIVLMDLVMDNIPQDVKVAYDKLSDLLAKVNVDMTNVEGYILSSITNADSLKNRAETVLNGEIDKITGEIVKVEDLLNTANTMTLSELTSAIAGLNCEYVKFAFGGNFVAKNADEDNTTTFDIYLTIFGKEYKIVTGELDLVIDPIELNVGADNQTIKDGQSIDQSMFTIYGPTLSDELMAEARGSIELKANGNEITPELKSGTVNFTIVEQGKGTLVIESDESSSSSEDESSSSSEDESSSSSEDESSSSSEDESSSSSEDESSSSSEDESSSSSEDESSSSSEDESSSSSQDESSSSTSGGDDTGTTGGNTTGGDAGDDDTTDDELETIEDDEAPGAGAPEDDEDEDEEETETTVQDVTPEDGEDGTIEIEDEQSPTASADDLLSGNSSFALVNIIAAVITAVMALALIVSHFAKGKGGLGLKLLSLIPLAAAVVLLLTTQDFSGVMAMVDMWTVVFAVVLAAQVVTTIIATKASKQDENLNTSDF